MKFKIGIVILNYMNYEDTIECVNCALNQTYSDYDIVIVENGSPNKSYEILKYIYMNCPKVTLIKSKKNLGFAKGNNIGIRFARERLNADYVFVCNNDIIFSEDLLETIIKVSYRGIGAISPSVKLLNGKSQTPSITADNIYIKSLLMIKGILLAWIFTIPLISQLYHNHKHGKKVQSLWRADKNRKAKHMLLGCAYFLTPNFFQFYKELYPDTFLYWEEINLIVYLEKVHLTSVIIDTSPVIHKEKRATRFLYDSNSMNKMQLDYATQSMVKSLPLLFMRYTDIQKKYN